MAKPVPWVLAISAVASLVALAGCETGHSARNRAINQAVADALDPTKLQGIVGVAFRLPDAPGWRIQTHEAYVFRATRTLREGHTAAVVVDRRYPIKTDYRTPQEFLAALSSSLRRLVPGELELLAFESALASSIGEYCVKYMKRTRAAMEGRPVGSVFELHGIGCRHPDQSSLFVDLTYSEFFPGPSGLSIHSRPSAAPSSEAQRFFSSVAFTRPNLRQLDEPGYVGLELRKDPTGQYVEVVRSTQGLDAERQGIKKGDRIVEINGADMNGRALADVVNQLRGAAGTRVQITVSRPDLDANVRFSVMRLPFRQ